MKPIKELLDKYVIDPANWVDPFAGDNSPCGFTNDINPNRKAKFHMDSFDFCKMVEGPFDGILFDPPYSNRQISEHYKEAGRKVTGLDTGANFYSRVIKEITPKIKIGGLAISFGWNSNGFAMKRGWEKIELLLVAHGSYHNDTICLVERKIK